MATPNNLHIYGWFVATYSISEQFPQWPYVLQNWKSSEEGFWDAHSAQANPSRNQPCDTFKWNFNHVILDDPAGDREHFSASKKSFYDRSFFL